MALHSTYFSSQFILPVFPDSIFSHYILSTNLKPLFPTPQSQLKGLLLFFQGNKSYQKSIHIVPTAKCILTVVCNLPFLQMNCLCSHQGSWIPVVHRIYPSRLCKDIGVASIYSLCVLHLQFSPWVDPYCESILAQSLLIKHTYPTIGTLLDFFWFSSLLFGHFHPFLCCFFFILPTSKYSLVQGSILKLILPIYPHCIRNFIL